MPDLLTVNSDLLLQRRIKVCPVLVRSGREILVFRHPSAGVQLVKGTLEAGEGLAAGALRELAEESGIEDAIVTRYLARWEPGYKEQEWHLMLCEVDRTLPDHWAHFTRDGGGLYFQFSWHPLDAPPASDWHPVYQDALALMSRVLPDVF